MNKRFGPSPEDLMKSMAVFMRHDIIMMQGVTFAEISDNICSKIIVMANSGAKIEGADHEALFDMGWIYRPTVHFYELHLGICKPWGKLKKIPEITSDENPTEEELRCWYREEFGPCI